MGVTWQKLQKTPQLNLEIELLEEIRDTLESGGKARIGEYLLTGKDIKDVKKLIDKEQRKNGGK